VGAFHETPPQRDEADVVFVVFEPLMNLELLRSLIWTDFRLALLFTVLMPLGLLAWAMAKRARSIISLLIIYWRVASLLLITLYLMVAENPMGYVLGVLGLLLILMSLWFWVDLNEEISDRQGTLKLCFSGWRWGVSAYALVAALGQIPWVRCALDGSSQDCQLWLQPALGFGKFFHSDLGDPKVGGRLEFVAIVGLVIYGLYFLNFLVLRLGKKGRSATGF
jgi:hypothetical protein